MHVGHVVAAVDVRAALGLDRVLMVPAGDPWQKRGQVVASPEQRFAMVELACAGIDGVEVVPGRARPPGPSVTADTLERLQRPDRELFLLLGADAVANMPTWRRLEETRDLAAIAVVERAGEHAEPPGPGWRFEHVTIPRLDVSSSEIRRRVGDGLPIDGLTPPAVVDFIRNEGLYTLAPMAQGAGGTVLDEPPPGADGTRRKRGPRPDASVAPGRPGAERRRRVRRARARRAGCGPSGAGSGSCSCRSVAVLPRADRRRSAWRSGRLGRLDRRTASAPTAGRGAPQPETLLLGHRGADGRIDLLVLVGADRDGASVLLLPGRDPGRGAVARARRRSPTSRARATRACCRRRSRTCSASRSAKTLVLDDAGLNAALDAGGAARPST